MMRRWRQRREKIGDRKDGSRDDGEGGGVFVQYHDLHSDGVPTTSWEQKQMYMTEAEDILF